MALLSKTMYQEITVAILAIIITVVVYSLYQILKNKNAKLPLGYKDFGTSKIKPTSEDVVKNAYHPSKVPKHIDYIVIGSGIGGTSTAAFLSRVGQKVLVLEQNKRLGGCCKQYNKEFQFEVGIHSVGKPEFYSEILAPITLDNQIQFVALGSKADGYVYDEFFIGKGDTVKIFKARAKTEKNDLKKQFNRENDRKAIDTFYKLQKDATILSLFVFAGKLLDCRCLSRFLFRIGQWKYPKLWNKSASDIFESLFSFNWLLGMSIMARVGVVGGTLKANAIMILFGALDHYKDGGYYIKGGAQQVIRSIVHVIEKSGGKCLTKAEVKKIIFENDRAVGVVINEGITLKAKHGVISAVGFRNTYTKLASIQSLPKTVSSYFKLQIQRLLNKVEPSPQHLRVCIGFNKTSNELGFSRTNQYYLQFADHDEKDDNYKYDYDELIQNFHKDPLKAPIAAFLSSASAKDPDFERLNPGKATIVIITEIPRFHFKKWENQKHDSLAEDYHVFTQQIANRLIEHLLFKVYPKCKGQIVKIDISTALSSEYYLGSVFGESYGLSHSCDRYFDYEINQLLKPKQAVTGLYLAGQDIFTAGFGGALQSGVWCAESILGYHKLSVLLSGRNLISDLNKMDGFQKQAKDMNTLYDYHVIRQQSRMFMK